MEKQTKEKTIWHNDEGKINDTVHFLRQGIPIVELSKLKWKIIIIMAACFAVQTKG